MDSPRDPVNPKRRWLVDGLRVAGHALLPPRCLLCGADGDARDLCAACADDLVRNDRACARCASPLVTAAARCDDCRRMPLPFAAAATAFVYAHPVDLLLTRLKFGARLAAGRVLHELWVAAWQQRLADGRIDTLPAALVPVPLHAARLRERGYNQALELARPLAAGLGIALRADLLQRTRATPAQTGLDAQARRRSLRDAFVVAPGATLPAHVALVDDVMTTGATLAECARILRRAGVARVDVWAVARAPRLR